MTHAREGGMVEQVDVIANASRSCNKPQQNDREERFNSDHWAIVAGALAKSKFSSKQVWLSVSLSLSPCVFLPPSLPQALALFCQCTLASPAGVWQLNISLGNEAVFRNHYKGRKSCPMSLAKTHGKLCVSMCVCVLHLRCQWFCTYLWLYDMFLEDFSVDNLHQCYEICFPCLHLWIQWRGKHCILQHEINVRIFTASFFLTRNNQQCGGVLHRLDNCNWCHIW